MKLSDYILVSPSQKAVSLEQFNNDALWKETGTELRSKRNKQADINKASNFRDAIGVIYRCIDVRASTVASIPFTVLRGSEIVYDSNVAWEGDKKLTWFMDIPEMLKLTEASLLLSSEAFWLKEFALAGNLLNLRWLAAPYITPVYDEVKGIIGFKRDFGKGETTYKRDDIAYFFVQNPMSELLPDIPQVLAAANSANVIINYEDFVAKFYQRGAVKATILKVDRSTPPKERARLRDFWQNFMAGGKNAYTTEVVSGDVEAEVIGEGAGDSEKTEVLVSRRKDIATAMGVPYSLLFGDTSSSYTAGPTETKNFLNFTIIPRVRLIQYTLNKQLFEKMGFYVKFATDNLPAFKDSDETESKIFTAYTSALIPHSVAAQLAGITMPEGVSYVDLDEMVSKERERLFKEKERIVTLNSKLVDNGEKPADPDKPDNNMRDSERKRFRKWLKNRKDETIDPYDFTSNYLDDVDRIEIFKTFSEERGSNDTIPFSLSDQVTIKGLVTIGNMNGEQDLGLSGLEEDGAVSLSAAFDTQLDAIENEEEAIAAIQGNSKALEDALFVMMLAFADFGVTQASKKIMKYIPTFDAEAASLMARQFAATRAVEAFRLIQDSTTRKVNSLLTEYRQINKPEKGWFMSELRKFVSDTRAKTIAENESMVVVRQAERIVYENARQVELVRWVSAADERVCSVCGPRHGRVYPLISAPRSPAHVRCRCALLPMVNTRPRIETLFR